MQNLKDLSDSIQTFQICTDEKYAQKQINKFCDC
jgi:hypothetical protein